jgi:hypothetical protein
MKRKTGCCNKTSEEKDLSKWTMPLVRCNNFTKSEENFNGKF